MSPRPVLVIGLGNPLMGDEGVGWHVAQRLRDDPRLPAHVEVISGGTDLFRCAGQMEGRRHVILVDAMLDERGSHGGCESLSGRLLADLDTRQGHAHSLSALQAVELLHAVSPGLEQVCFAVAPIAIESASFQPGLSPALAAEIPEIIDRLLEELKGGNGQCASPYPAES